MEVKRAVASVEVAAEVELMAIAAARDQQAEQRRRETAMAVTSPGVAVGGDGGVVVAVGGSERVTQGEVTLSVVVPDASDGASHGGSISWGGADQAD